MTREIEGFKVRSTFKDHTGKKYYNLQIGKLERRSDNGLSGCGMQFVIAVTQS